MSIYGNTRRVHVMGVYARVTACGTPYVYVVNGNIQTQPGTTRPSSPARHLHRPTALTLLHFLNTSILPFPILLVGGEVVSRVVFQVWQ